MRSANGWKTVHFTNEGFLFHVIKNCLNLENPTCTVFTYAYFTRKVCKTVY